MESNVRIALGCSIILLSSWVCSAQQAVDLKTPSGEEVYAAIVASMTRYDAFSFRASFLESRAIYGTPDTVMGNGEWNIVSDGSRWKCVERTFDTKREKTGITTKPVERRAGYDGKDYWHSERRVVQIGEKEFALNRLAPKEVFWHLGSNRGWLEPILTQYDVQITPTEVDGRRCWKIVSDTPKKDIEERGLRAYRFELVVSPSQSWLPLTTTVTIDGKLDSTETLSKLKSTDAGVWYPTLIVTERPHAQFGAKKSRKRILEFSTDTELADEDFVIDQPLNCDVMDYGEGFAWKNGPWWPDLSEFLRTEMEFPRKNPAPLHSIKTYATNPDANGTDAPPLRVRKWFGTAGKTAAPAKWKDRAKDTTSILFFFGGSASAPSSRWIHGLRTLKQHYPDAPIELIGIASSETTEEELLRTIETLHIDFPVAIDSSEKDKSKSEGGQTHSSFQMKFGVILVDPMQKIRFIESDSLKLLTNLARFGTLTPEEPIKPLPDYRISLKEHHKIEQHWKKLAKTAPANGSISGKVQFVRGAASDKFESDPGGELVGAFVDLALVPKLLVASHNTTLSYTGFSDPSRTQQMQTDANGEFEFTGLTKGRYELTISSEFGLAKSTHEFTVPTGDSKVEVAEIRLQQSGEITGVVLDENDKPVANAKITAIARHFNPSNLTMETNAHLPSAQTTNAKGQFHFKDLHVGAYSFKVRADGYTETRQGPVAAGIKDAKLRLRRAQQ